MELESLNTAADNDLCKVADGEVNVENLVSMWTDKFSKEVLTYAKVEQVATDTTFGEIYHSLIHSEYLEALLQLEHHYSYAVNELLEKREVSFSNIYSRQREEMEDAVKRLGSGCTDEQINFLAQRHFEYVEMLENKWSHDLKQLQENQRREYREWVIRLYEDFQRGDRTSLTKLRLMTGYDNQLTGGRSVDNSSLYARREESFTVHLGAQLKMTHNLRIISADVLDFCKHKRQSDEEGISSNLLQTAMSLYSNSLSGLVLLVDNRLNSYTGIKLDFSRVCQQSTDFHILTLEQQFSDIERHSVEAGAWRTKKKSNCLQDFDKLSIKSSGSSISSDDNKMIKLQTGDCYITKHSNLSEVHVVFHLVTDDTVRSSSDLSSRHPIILGYRSVLKCCFRYDIRVITLPLLLIHEMSEEMTIAWCLKRAELVFKCIKGFIMELAMWSGQESITIQFLVPKGLSDETYSSLSSMMPSIFRMSNPVIAKS